MTIVRATCPDCGDVQVRSEEVQVRLCVEDHRGSYAFRCPRCKMAVGRQTTSAVVHLLVNSGASLVRWRLPAELDEVHFGPPFTYDDLGALRRLLDSDDWLARVSAQEQGGSRRQPGEPR